MPDRVRAIIFDLDGVIADSHPLHERAWRALLKEERVSLSGAELAQFVRQGKKRVEMLKTLFPEADASELARLSERKDELYRAESDGLKPVPGVLAWIERLHAAGVGLALATSASRLRALETLVRFGLSSAFAASVVTGSDVAAGKPDPALFLTAASDLQVRPEEVLVIEDAAAGVAAAHTAGMRCVAYCPESDPAIAALAPWMTLSSFDETSLTPIDDLLGIPALSERA